ncbi:MAG: ABC transporter permease family protein, partial [Planctomycetota bacterium]
MHGMMTYFIRRALLIPVTFICITLMVYTVLRLVPGGPIEQAQIQIRQAMQGEGGAGSLGMQEETQISQDGIEQLKEYYKLDKPIIVGYLYWLGGVLTGNFGKSYQYGDPVLEVVVSKIPISIWFGLSGYIASWLICVPLGIFKALKHRTVFDTGTSILVFLGYSIPGFVACLILLVLFGGGSYWDIVPLGGFQSDNFADLNFLEKVVDRAHHMIVPVIGYLVAGFAMMTIL